MKLILLSLVTCLVSHAPSSQWSGVLTYTDNFESPESSGKTITIIYESGNKGRIESKTFPTKIPGNDLSEQDQNVLIYDFSKQQKTTLVTKMNMATIISIAADDQLHEQLMIKEGATYQVEKIGTEKVGSFNCTRYVLNVTSTKMKMPPNAPKKNIWVTGDLGNSNIWYVGPYLYYLNGGFLQKKMAEAGVSGVVVKWQLGNAQATLTDHQQRSVPSSMFEIPSGYTSRTVDESQYHLK